MQTKKVEQQVEQAVALVVAVTKDSVSPGNPVTVSDPTGSLSVTQAKEDPETVNAFNDLTL